MSTERWIDRAASIIEQHGNMNRVRFSELSGLNLNRAGAVLCRAKDYGKILLISPYKVHWRPELRVAAVYGPKPKDLTNGNGGG